MENKGDKVMFTATPGLPCEIGNYHFASASCCWRKLLEPIFLPALRLFHPVHRENNISQSIRLIINLICLAALGLKVEKMHKTTAKHRLRH